MHNQTNRKNIAIYTAIFGDYDDLKIPKNEFIKQEADFICFTDNPNLKSDFYNIIPFKRIHKDPVRNARYCKVMSHKLLPEYEYVIWVDANLVIVTDNVTSFLKNYLNDANIAAYHHDCRNCLYEEAEWCMSVPVDNPRVIQRQMKKYKMNHYPINDGLINSNIIFRRNFVSEIYKLNESWYNEIKEGSRRDQLSFNYVKWRLNVKINYIEGLWYNNTFAFRQEHKKDYPPFSKESKIVIASEKLITLLVKILKKIQQTFTYIRF